MISWRKQESTTFNLKEIEMETVIIAGTGANSYKTTFFEVLDDENAWIIITGGGSIYRVGGKLSFFYYVSGDQGLIKVPCKILERKNEGNMRMLRIQVSGNIIKIQRRDYVRIPAVLNTTITVDNFVYNEKVTAEHFSIPNNFSAHIIDLSAGGIKINTTFTLTPRTKITLAFKLDGVALTIPGIIRWGFLNDYGIHFTNVDKKTRAFIVRYVSKTQSKIIKMASPIIQEQDDKRKEDKAKVLKTVKKRQKKTTKTHKRSAASVAAAKRIQEKDMLLIAELKTKKKKPAAVKVKDASVKRKMDFE